MIWSDDNDDGDVNCVKLKAGQRADRSIINLLSSQNGLTVNGNAQLTPAGVSGGRGTSEKHQQNLNAMCKNSIVKQHLTTMGTTVG